jgi:uncharacterized protein
MEELFEQGRIARQLTVTIIGGEPLLAFEGLVAMVRGLENLACRYQTQLTFGMTTNGYLLDDRVAAWIEQHAVALRVSFDGRFQDVNRPSKRKGAGGLAGDHLDRIVDLARRIPLTASATLNPPQLGFQAAVFADLWDCGFRSIQIGVTNGVAWNERDLRSFLEGLHRLAVESSARGKLEIQLAGVLSTLRRNELRRHHCGAGIGHLAFDADGNEQGCSTSFNEARHGRRPRFDVYDVLSDPACRRCAFRYNCGGGCRAFREDDRPHITDCAPLYLRFLLALMMSAGYPALDPAHDVDVVPAL